VEEVYYEDAGRIWAEVETQGEEYYHGDYWTELPVLQFFFEI